MGTTSDLKPGVIINFNNELYTVLSVEHRTPGNLRAFYQVKMRNLKNFRILENRFRSGEEVEVVRLDSREYQYLYHDGESLVFMDNQTYDQVTLNDEVLGKQVDFLKEGETVRILYHDSTPLMAELPPHVILKVVTTMPGFKGDTVNMATKPATLETGYVVEVPLFIKEGDAVKIDTRSGQYIERAKA